MCFVFIREQTATCATYSINWLVFITETKSIYYTVRTGSLTLLWPAGHIYVPLTKSFLKSVGITVSHFFSVLPSTMKYLYSVEPVRMHFPAKQPYTNDTVFNAACSIAHSIICTWLFCGKMHSDWFNGIGILQGRWQREEKVGYCYPNGLEKTLCKWVIYMSRRLQKG